MKKVIITLVMIPLLSWGEPAPGKPVPVENLTLPDGFSIRIFAEVRNPRQLSRSDAGIIYVGSRRAGRIHAIIDDDGDYRADRIIEIDRKLNLPSGVTWHKGDLYVGAVSRILRYPDIDSHLDDPPEPLVIIDSLPDKRHHGWKFIEFGPDGYLYIPVGAPCNICLSERREFATILRADISRPRPVPEIFAEGVRNSVGFDWHPETGELWFTDNGRDMLGDDLPPCELNRAPEAGLHFGYPYFHGNDIPDPEFGRNRNPRDYERPALTLGPHVAPLGMMFYTGSQFPARYRNAILIAEHGSWNRSEEAGHTGYRVIAVMEDDNGTMREETFIDGWLVDNKAWGRPADIMMLPDGSILISDDQSDVIYRVSYDRVASDRVAPDKALRAGGSISPGS